jgi:hypothetical protein
MIGFIYQPIRTSDETDRRPRRTTPQYSRNGLAVVDMKRYADHRDCGPPAGRSMTARRHPFASIAGFFRRLAKWQGIKAIALSLRSGRRPDAEAMMTCLLWRAVQ